MKRVLLDTSVYGELVIDVQTSDALLSLVPIKYVIYGVRIIRNELRDISKEAKVEGKSKRNLLLQLYDSFVKKENHNLDMEPIVEVIAGEFYKKYRSNGGSKSLHDMITDLRIVACASFHNLDVVVSKDTKSMLSPEAIEAYKKICNDFGLHVPEFIPYAVFKETITHD